jgi:hypothetical protein
VIYEVEYINYPQANPEYATPVIDGEGGEAEARFPSVFEIIDENWEVSVTFFEEEYDPITLEGTKSLTIPTKVLSWNLTPVSDSIQTIVDNTNTQAKITFKGTWTDRFDQRRFDFRMTDGSIRIDGNVGQIGDNYYGPINFIADRRVWLESTYTVNVESVPNDPETGSPLQETITTFERKQTVLNNWDANRRKLVELRNYPKRKEQLDASVFGKQANS